MSAYPLSTRRPRNAIAGLTALGAALAVVLSACGGSTGSGTAAAASSSSAVLKWATTYFPAHWDPVVNGAGAQFRPLTLVYASITNVDAHGNPTPGLASSWTYNAASTEVTFHIRPGLKFSDGTPVNAAAIKDAIVRAKTQEDSALVEDLEPVERVTTSGAYNVEVYLNHPDFQIPLVFGERVMLIASPKAAADPTKLDQFPVGRPVHRHQDHPWPGGNLQEEPELLGCEGHPHPDRGSVRSARAGDRGRWPADQRLQPG